MLSTLRKLIKVLRGECIVLIVEGETLIVDAGNKSPAELRNVASAFFKSAYSLG